MLRIIISLLILATATIAIGEIPLWIKIAYTLFVCLLVPFYTVNYGLANFLWFSDIALLTTVAALWLESRLLASMMAIGIMVPESVWMLSFFGRWLIGIHFTGLADYMFDPKKSLFLRVLSLFHIFVPILLLWMLFRLGYDPRALIAQTLLAWIVLPVTYLFTDPAENINWVFGLKKGEPQTWLPPLLYLGLLMIGFPLFIYWPTHLVFQLIFPRQ